MSVAVNGEFLMSIEEELLTAAPDDPEHVGTALRHLLRWLTRLAPSLAAPEGVFNAYARLYFDCGHLEAALSEAHSPYYLALLADCLHHLVARACECVAAGGTRLLFANNNHSGLLCSGCPMWGTHENYLVERHPNEFAALILPFLVTRLYAGSGGVESPTGRYVASVRALCMEQATGGSTTSGRAIHSTCRDEHHMGRRPRRYRYHGLLGDGHRSQFNLALQLGATALALKGVIFDRRLPEELARLGNFSGGDWLGTLNRFNVLQAEREGTVRIDPQVIRVQRVYLDAARRYVDQLATPPEWTLQTLADWEATLTAFERMDRPWLAARLDAFAKYEFFTGVLESEGVRWPDLPQQPGMFYELTLLNHSYHNIVDANSAFNMLEAQGLLQHRVGPPMVAGGEPEPYVPETTTRARPRAKFIKEFAQQDRYLVDWSCVWDRQENRMAPLEDPFAAEFAAWRPLSIPSELDANLLAIRHLQQFVTDPEDVPF